MLTEVAAKSADDIAPITKVALEETLKEFAKKELASALTKLHSQIKKDIHTEVASVLNNDAVRFKNLEGALGKISTKVDEEVARKLHRKADVKKNQTISHKAELKSRKTMAKLATEQASPHPENDQHTREEPGTRVLTVVGNNENKDETIHDPSEQLLPADASPPTTFIQRLVLSKYFEYAMAVLVLLNVVLLGFETQLQASDKPRKITGVLDILFTIIFTTELSLRLYVYGVQIWLDDFLFQSMCFDALLVLLQVVDQVVSTLDMNVHVLSVLRIFRIARVIRLFHLFDELSALISGMFNSLNTLLWTCFIVALMMYMFGIIIMQALMTSGDLQHENLHHWFGSVERSMSTMFEVILGGIDWGLVLETLCYDVSPIMGIIMATYIIITLFFMMNLVCGVFVDRVTKTVREDKDEHFAKRLSEAFTTVSGDGQKENEVNLADFTKKLAQNLDVQAYFKSLDVQPDTASARGLFELIDADGSGHISASEIVAGCLRLRGPAKALEMALMSSDVHRVCMQVAANSSALDRLGVTLKPLPKLLQQMDEALQKIENRTTALEEDE